MRCPFCAFGDTRVVDSRPADGGRAIRRRRECSGCGNRFTTYERREPTVMVRKRDGSLQPFDAEKVLRGMSNALADREVAPGTLEQLVREIEAYVHDHGPVVSSDEIGRQVLAGLRVIDEIAYLRFASVYKSFTGASDFEREMAAMGDEVADGPAEP
jgi:transcriptional repressor NrdR